METPVLSVVIVNFNYGRFIGQTLKSIFSQFDKQPTLVRDVEVLVVDGGSTDNSAEVIRGFSDRLAWWCSEKDKGQSDAFNKGFSHARGKYLTWVNADDLMVAGCLEKIVSALHRHPTCEWFTGNMFRFGDDGSVLEVPWGPHFLPKWLQTRHMPIATYGPSTIFSKRIYEAAGGMKIYQNFMMDTDLWMRFVMMGVKQHRINCFCWAFRMHVDSKTAEYGEHKLTPEQRARFEEERKRAHQETGYQVSRVNLRALQLWRVFDGSILRGWLIKRRFKHYAV